MKHKLISFASILIFTVISENLLMSKDVWAQIVTCVDIGTTISLNSNDANSNGLVSKLQNYLVNLSFLYKTPNGIFDDQTEEAVKQFQSVNSLNPSGILDLVTASKIKTLTCPIKATTFISPIQSATTSSIIKAPVSGENLNIGNSYMIIWNNNPGISYDILLVGLNTSDGGYVASSLSSIGSFAWKIGDVTNINNPFHHYVIPGTYRIDIRSSIGGGSVVDNYSGIVNINSAQLRIDQIFPSSVQADGITSVVLYGSGFRIQDSIAIDGIRNSSMVPQYVSLDGRVLLLTVPVTTNAGSHSLQIVRDALTSIPSFSNSVNFFVNNMTSSITQSSSQTQISNTATPLDNITTTASVSNAVLLTNYYFNKYLYVGLTPYGVSDPDVEALQKRLKEDGLFSASITGYFGPATKSAVQAYQSKHSLSPIGVVGPATRLLLNKGI